LKFKIIAIMSKIISTKNIGIFAFLFFFLTVITYAQEKTSDGDVAQANNPLANFTAFNVHYYYMADLSEMDKDANQVWMRFAKPFSIGKSKWLMRASLPINSYPIPPTLSYTTGLGDLNVFAANLIDVGNPSLSFGIGPQITAPTATSPELGSGKWSAGLVNTLFNFKSKVFQYGYLLSWQASFAGASDRDNVNVGALQPFLFYQLGKGKYLRSTGAAMYNFENSTYTVPVGLGFGQVIPHKKAVFNLFIEPQYSIADKGAGYAQWQIFFGLNTQFK
jgi:hypothetical protein